jgi:hypothetical protein
LVSPFTKEGKFSYQFCSRFYLQVLLFLRTNLILNLDNNTSPRTQDWTFGL